MDSSLGETFLPYAFRAVGRHRIVDLVDPGRIDWRHGFFVRSLPADRPLEALAPFDDWRSNSAIRDDFAGVGCIFHVSRCGSTLLAQNLKATGKAIVLSEPPFMRIIRTCFNGTLTREAAAAAVARVIGQWRAWAETQGKVLIIKFNSQMHEWRDVICAALPGARFVFLHREPAPVLESIARGPPQYLRREIAQRRHDGFPEFDRLDDDPLLLAAARRYCAALDAFADESRDVERIAYRDLADRFARLCSHFGIAGIDESAWNPAIAAKSPDPGSGETYRPVGKERMTRFAASHEQLLAVADARYRIFLGGGIAPARKTGETAA